MYTCENVAERYSVKMITVWDWIRKKKLPAIKIGRDYRISEEDIKIFEESRRTIPTTKKLYNNNPDAIRLNGDNTGKSVKQ